MRAATQRPSALLKPLTTEDQKKTSAMEDSELHPLSDDRTDCNEICNVPPTDPNILQDN